MERGRDLDTRPEVRVKAAGAMSGQDSFILIIHGCYLRIYRILGIWYGRVMFRIEVTCTTL